jgi:hypothetical protein
MKKIFNTLWFIVTILLISDVRLNAQKIEFEATSHNFGLFPNNIGPATHTFRFKNTGDKPLVIKGVIPKCGCTSPAWTKEPVQPGETGEVKVAYTSTNSLSSFNKNLTVNTNGQPSSVVLNVRGTVTSDVNAAFPDSIGTLKVKDGKQLTFTQVSSSQTSWIHDLEVANFTDKDIILSVGNVPDCLTVKSDSVVKPKTRSLINVSVDGTKFKKYGYQTVWFTLKADGVKDRIKVAAVIAEDIANYDNPPVTEVDSLAINLGSKPAKENKISEQLVIRNTGSSDLVIKSFTTDNPLFVSGLRRELKISSGKTGTVKYSTKHLPSGDHSANVYLTTNDPKMPILNFTIKIKIE